MGSETAQKRREGAFSVVVRNGASAGDCGMKAMATRRKARELGCA